MVDLDGSRGEGGGQVLRSALTCSAWLHRPFRMTRIRAGRKQPGLKAQHLAAVRMVAQICGATVEGAEPGSQNLIFQPGDLRAGRYAEAVGTAGATTLVAQAAALPLLRLPEASRLRIAGGTHVAWSPPVEFLQLVYAPVLQHLGLHLQITLRRHGFYPRGGGEIDVEVQSTDRSALDRLTSPDTAPALTFERPRRNRIRIEVTAVVSSLPRSIAERMLMTVAEALRAKRWKARERIVEAQGPPGTYVFIRVGAGHPAAEGAAGFIAGGFTGLGVIRKPAEKVAREAVEEALAFLESDASIDSHLADQILLPAALAGKDLSFTTDRISSHLDTQVATLALFLGPCVTVTGGGRIHVCAGLPR